MIELQYCYNCHREHCLHPSIISPAFDSKQRLKRGISTTAKKSSFVESDARENYDFDYSPKVGSSKSNLGGSESEWNQYQINYDKINKISRMLSYEERSSSINLQKNVQ